MSKIFSDTDRMKWLELNEKGKSEIWIAREHAHCDTRTVKIGIEKARRKRDANVARIEMVKDALRKHQDDLLIELQKISSSLVMPPVDFTVLSWNRGDDSVFSVSDRKGDESEPVLKTEKYITKYDLLKEHLKNDKLWNLMTQRERDYRENAQLRAKFQRRIVTVLGTQTGYPVDDGKKLNTNLIYSYTTGELFLQSVFQKAFKVRPTVHLEEEIYADTARGLVQYRNSILAEVPGHEEKCRKDLLAALRKLQRSTLVKQLFTAYNSLAGSNERAKKSVEQLLLLNLVPGQCQVCRRLGI